MQLCLAENPVHILDLTTHLDNILINQKIMFQCEISQVSRNRDVPLCLSICLDPGILWFSNAEMDAAVLRH